MSPAAKKYISKELWLDKALKQLGKKGNLGLTIEDLSKAVGVTKGSFYWHFKNRDDFVRSLFDHWAELSTTNVIEHVSQVKGSASDRLLALTRFLIEKDICKYELSIRGWVQIYPKLIPLLEQVDLRRYQYVANLFQELGFTGDDQAMRVRTFLVFYGLETSLYPNQKLQDRLVSMTLRHQCLTEAKHEN